MTEEVKVPGSEGTNEQSTEPKQYSEIELRAMDMGWRPQEEFEGNPDDFVDAKEFVRRQPLFDKIESQSKELKNVKKALDALKQHYTSVKEAEYNRAVKALEAAREQAITEGDGAKFTQLDKELKNVEAQNKQIEALKTEPSGPPQEFVEWNNRNKWYQSDEDMTVFADAYGMRYKQNHPETPPAKVLEEVEKAVKRNFPNKFENPRKANAPDVDTSKGSSRKSVSSGEADLTEQERQIMNTLVRGGHITKEKYLDDLKKVKNLTK